jgi:hypothetical protein
MQTLAPEYLAEIARQVGSLSAFLGGFAAAFLGTLLALNSPRRLAGWAIAWAAFAAMAFIVTVVASTKMVIVLHPQSPAGAAAAGGIGAARVIAVLGFLLGAYALLVSMGLCGWLRSRRTGWVTSGLAGLAALLITSLLVSL